jgi:hypothetical protein
MKKLVLAAALILGANAAQAVTDAGCGLGSLIITENTKLMQVLAATTNGIGMQTFAITSGTSNCTAENFVMREKAVRYFAEVNQQDLTREMAIGAGEKLTTLASLYGCQGNAQKAFAQMTQSSYGQIVSSQNISAGDMVNNLNSQLKNSSVAKACNIQI